MDHQRACWLFRLSFFFDSSPWCNRLQTAWFMRAKLHRARDPELFALPKGHQRKLSSFTICVSVQVGCNLLSAKCFGPPWNWLSGDIKALYNKISWRKVIIIFKNCHTDIIAKWTSDILVRCRLNSYEWSLYHRYEGCTSISSVKIEQCI